MKHELTCSGCGERLRLLSIYQDDLRETQRIARWRSEHHGHIRTFVYAPTP